MTVNLVNNKKYIGKDSKNDPDYLGSGTVLRRSIIKHGRENFKKIILDSATTLDELDSKEIMWIEKFDAANDKMFYNIAAGGSGGFTVAGKSEEERKAITKRRITAEAHAKTCETIRKKVSKLNPVADDVLRLYKEGMLIKEIAKKFGVSEPTVRLFVKKRGVTARKTKKTIMKYEHQKLAKGLSKTLPSVYAVHKEMLNRGIRYDYATVQKIIS